MLFALCQPASDLNASPRRFDHIYLHIGLGKTGSSSLQTYLQSQAATLEKEHGILYPDFSTVERRFDGNHSRYLQLLFADDEYLQPVFALRGHNSVEAQQRYRALARADWDRALQDSPARRLLLSAESLGHDRRPYLEALRDQLQSLGDRITVIACIRHPYSALASEIQQRVKAGAILEDLYQNPPFYALRPLVSRFAELFGPDNIRLYDFEKARRNPGGLERTFLEVVGIDLPPVVVPKAQNASMSMKATLLLSSLNRQQPLLVDGRRNPLRTHDLQGRMSAIAGDKFAAPAEVYARLEAEITPHLRWLRNQYHFKPEMGDVRFAPEGLAWHSAALDREARWRARYWRVRGRLLAWFKGRPYE